MIITISDGIMGPYNGPVIPTKTLLKDTIPTPLLDFLDYAWLTDQPVCIAGSFPAYSIGVTKTFNDIDIFCTNQVLRSVFYHVVITNSDRFLFRQLRYGLDVYNKQSDTSPLYHIAPKNGYTGSVWKKQDNHTDFILKTYELVITNRSLASGILLPTIQFIERVNWTHPTGHPFVKDLLSHFDLCEAQVAIYNYVIVRAFSVPLVQDRAYELVRLRTQTHTHTHTH